MQNCTRVNSAKAPWIHGLARATVCLLALTGAAAHAQNWKPEKNIEIFIGLTAGSSQDRTGRALQRVWQETKALSVPVNVVNRPGGGGQVALTALAQHAGDPHYLHIVSPTIVARYITGLGTFQFSDFTPLALFGNQWEPEYLNSTEFIKHLHMEEKRLRAALTDLGLARQ